MVTLIRATINKNGVAKKVYEESSIMKRELFKKYMGIKPNKREVVLLFEGNGSLYKGARPLNLGEIKPIV